MFAAFKDVYPNADKEITHRRDVVEGIIETAENIIGSTIALRPRGESRIIQLLAGDGRLQLVTDSPIPVISLPGEETND